MSNFPFSIGNDTPLGRKLRTVWAMVEEQVRTSGLEVLVLTTRSAEWKMRDFPDYTPWNLELVIDITSGFESVLEQLLEGLGLHLHRDLHGPSRKAIRNWWNRAAEWAECYRNVLAAEDRRQPPERRQRYGGRFPRCCAIKRDGTRCGGYRWGGTAQCYSHQHFMPELYTVGQLAAEVEHLRLLHLPMSRHSRDDDDGSSLPL